MISTAGTKETQKGVSWLFQFVLTIALGCGMVMPGLAQAGKRYPDLVEEVRHQLVMLPYYGVFDNLEFRLDGDTVVLSGQVTRPTLKADAERVVKRLESVSKVVNNIEVLPVGGHDDDIRIAAYRAIFSRPGLDRYAHRAVPPIHIIVKNGNITLVGVVANEGDKNLAGIAAKGVSGAFNVENKLTVERN